MNYSGADTTANFHSFSPFPSTSSASTTSFPPPPPPPVVLSPCAACKILRRRCDDKCVLAPYFPPTEQLKFTTAHRVFGASNIIKLLQELPESQRADAVSSMVYEANARIRDPVYGSAGAICQLQKQVCELQAQLARSQAELLNLQTQQANLFTLIYVEMAAQSNLQLLPPCDPPEIFHGINRDVVGIAPCDFDVNVDDGDTLFIDQPDNHGSIGKCPFGHELQFT